MEPLTKTLAVIFFVKLILVGLTYPECIGAFVVFLALQSDRMNSYIFPKRPDIYQDVQDLKEKAIAEKTVIDEIQADITGFKLQGLRK